LSPCQYFLGIWMATKRNSFSLYLKPVEKSPRNLLSKGLQ